MAQDAENIERLRAATEEMNLALCACRNAGLRVDLELRPFTRTDPNLVAASARRDRSPDGVVVAIERTA